MIADTPTQSQDAPHIPHEVSDMVQHLVEAMQPERIYLFGSFARGDTNHAMHDNNVAVYR